jgi:hypothetical protein
MPQGMGYPKGDMVMKKGSRTMSQLMGIEKGEHGMKKKPNMAGVMKAETKEYGKRPASKAAMMRGEMKEHPKMGGKKPMFPFKKGGK